jgi:predicted amidohydrolase YtcJ
MRWIKRISIAVLLLLVVSTIGLYGYSKPPRAASDLLFFNGTIVTMDDRQAEAVLVRNGQIAAVGSEVELRDLMSPSGEEYDLAGRTLIPGLIEAHTHPIAAGLLSTAVDVSGFTHDSREQMIQALVDAYHAPSITPWIIAFGWDPIQNPSLKAPTLAELDEISPDRPLFVLTQMMHEAYANSAALAAAGITVNTPNPVGGEFVKDIDNQLTGTVIETNAVNLVLAGVPKPPAGIHALLTQRFLGEYAKAGFTTIGVLGPVGKAPTPLAMLETVFDNENAPVRGVVWALSDQLSESSVPTSGSRYSLRGVKFWMDGSPFAGGAAWEQPYENSELVLNKMHVEENHLAGLNHENDAFESLFRDHHNRGFSVAVHVQGERAVDRVLDVVERVLASDPRADHRHRLEHNALISQEQIARANKIGITLSFFVDHIWYYGDKLPQIVGEQRTKRYMPLRWAQDQGVKLTIHADNPATPVGPFRTINTAITRRSQAGGLVGADQALTAQQALAAITINAAWQLGKENQIGSISAGKQADFAVLSANPLTIPATELAQIEVSGTWIDGQPVDTRLLSRRNLSLALDIIWPL